ncbi:MAG TPA: hypothetical protein ENK75_03215, partial [Saprospiraceae bacterium]|nr:hypothetical protein [Saprospiraceae bacterium]
MSGKKTKQKRKVNKPARKSNKPKRSRTWAIWIVAILIIAILSILAFSLLSDNNSKKHHKNTASLNQKGISSCLKSPVFPLKFGLKGPFAVDLRQNNESMGLKIMEAKTGRTIQLPGWKKFGYLGLYTLDDRGNIYTSPVPYVSIDINPPDQQNKILIVDAKTGEMKEYMNL